MKMSMMHNVTKAVHDRVSQNVPQNSIGINTEGALNAMDLNRDCSRVVVAGRNVFKIYAIEDDNFIEKFNLRVGRNLNLNFSTSDVAWSHIDENILASAATNAAVVIWDLNKTSKSKQEFVFQEHTRTVNRVRFHQVEGNYILSGSQDGSMKIFDIRMKRIGSNFSIGSTSIRDVQFCPSNMNYFAFAAADEGGNIQLWDMRRPNSPEKQFTAHGGPVFCVDWHPSEAKWLATGGRDRTIKVSDYRLLGASSLLKWGFMPLDECSAMSWDSVLTIEGPEYQKCFSQKVIWDHAQGKLLYSVPTIASVARIKWRPERKFHIASCSLVIDFSVNVWDVRRPFIPFASFEEHKNVATGIVWKKDDGHTFYSCSKDNYLYQHVFKDAVRPADNVVPDGLGISVLGHIAHATKDKTKSVEKKKYSMFSKQPDKGDLFIDAKSFLYSFTDCHQSLSMEWLVNCANQYVLHGQPLEDMCEHNAEVSEQNNRPKVAQSWRMLKAIYSTPIISRGLLRTDSVISNISEKPKDKVKQPDTCTPKSVKEKDKIITEITSEDDDLTDIDLSNIARGQINPPEEWDFLFGVDMPVEPSLEPFGHTGNLGRDFKLPKEAFVPRHEIKDPSEVPKQSNHDSPPVSANESEAYPPVSHSLKLNHEEMSILFVVNGVEIADLEFSQSVEEMLKYFAEQGDVQTPVCMLVVLGERRPKIPMEIQEDWFISYLELLSRFKLWTISNTLINLSHLDSISMMNHQSTTINITCNQCSRPLTRVGWLCDKCKSVINTCSICHLPVKGLFVWCQGCSHGGHINHIQEWLTVSNQCPAGCGHVCEYT